MNAYSVAEAYAIFIFVYFRTGSSVSWFAERTVLTAHKYERNIFEPPFVAAERRFVFAICSVRINQK